jgi:flagellar hook assembly protein FlgD
VRLEVADVSGRVVKVLTDTEWAAGRHSIIWTGDNGAGETAGPGLYFVRMAAGGFSASGKVLLMK